jgi:hypothetical protein
MAPMLRVARPRRTGLGPIPASVAVTLALAILLTYADAATFLIMVTLRGMIAEGNPLVVGLVEAHGLLPIVALRLVLVSVAAVVVATIGGSHRTLARILLLAIAAVGAVGALSNVTSW